MREETIRRAESNAEMAGVTETQHLGLNQDRAKMTRNRASHSAIQTRHIPEGESYDDASDE
jgi:hypothetical protein